MRYDRFRIIGCAFLVLTSAWEAAGQGVITIGPPTVPTTRMTQRFNPATGRWENIGIPYAAPVAPRYPGYPSSTSLPYPSTNPGPGPGYPTNLPMPYPSTNPGPAPYPTYPYVTPNPYPGGNWGAVPQPSGSQTPDQQVSIWYSRYLRRQVDPTGMQAHIQAYYQGGPEAALAGILGSQEYFQLWGRNPQRFVSGLYSDILRRGPRREELNLWARQVGRKTQTQLALDFLYAARNELGGPYY